MFCQNCRKSKFSLFLASCWYVSIWKSAIEATVVLLVSTSFLLLISCEFVPCQKVGNFLSFIWSCYSSTNSSCWILYVLSSHHIQSRYFVVVVRAGHLKEQQLKSCNIGPDNPFFPETEVDSSIFESDKKHCSKQQLQNQNRMANSVDPDEIAQYESSHQDV